MMKKVNILLFCLFSFATVNPDNYKLILTVPVNTQDFTTDHLGNVFLITDNRLIKIDLNGQITTNNDEKNLGTPVSVDASNPFKIVTFYRDFSRVQILDNKLVVRADVNLTERNILQPLAVGYAQGEGLWIYDQQDFRLKKFDNQFRLIAESSSLDQVLTSLPQPIIIQETENWLLMNDPARGIFVFDRFGTYYRTLPLLNINSFQVRDGKIIYFRDTLRTFDLNTLEESELALPAVEGKRNVRIENKRIYILRDGFLEIYES